MLVFTFIAAHIACMQCSLQRSFRTYCKHTSYKTSITTKLLKIIKMENIRQKLNIKLITLLAIIIILALFAFFTSYSSLGALLLLAAVALPFFGIKKEVYTLTGSPVKRLTFYFEGEKMSSVERSIKASFRDEAPKVAFLSYGNGRIDVTISKDRKYAVVKLSRYVPHKYEQVGEEVTFTNDEVTSLCNYLGIK